MDMTRLDPTDPDSAIAATISISVLMFKKDLEPIKEALQEAKSRNEPLALAGFLTIRPSKGAPQDAKRNWIKFEPVRVWDNERRPREQEDAPSQAIGMAGGEQVIDGDLPF
jgi:hypothetical protein